jgi:hypothetical protein
LDGSEHKVNAEEKAGAPLQISDAIDRLLANPELLSTVASAIGAQAPTNVTAKKENEATDGDAEAVTKSDTVAASTPAESDISSKFPELMANVAPVIAALSGGGKGGKQPDDDRTRLLCALKPYVNPHRREAIDTMVQLARISEVIKTFK